MSHGRHVKRLKNGRSQAVRVPRECELPGDGPASAQSLLAALVRLQPIGDNIGTIDDPLPEHIEF